MVDLSIYGGLFAVALVAATLFPLQSEALPAISKPASKASD
jgi:membrane protein YqaA with SNARE-associated domain